MKNQVLAAWVLAALLFAADLPRAAQADPVADFYKGKQMWSTFLADELPDAIEPYLGADRDRRAIEAAVRQPWDWLLLGERGNWKRAAFVGMTGFGASAPADRLYKEFGITPEDTVAKVKALL